MALDAHWYGLGMLKVISGATNLDTGTLKAAILTSSYTPNIDTDQYWSGISSFEASGTGYTAGGTDVSSLASWSYDTATNTVMFDITADITWASSTITGKYVVFYISTGTASTSPLIVWQDANTNIVSSGGAWTFSPNSGGIATVTLS